MIFVVIEVHLYLFVMRVFISHKTKMILSRQFFYQSQKVENSLHKSGQINRKLHNRKLNKNGEYDHFERPTGHQMRQSKIFDKKQYGK